MANEKYVDSTGLTQFWSNIKTLVTTKACNVYNESDISSVSSTTLEAIKVGDVVVVGSNNMPKNEYLCVNRHTSTISDVQVPFIEFINIHNTDLSIYVFKKVSGTWGLDQDNSHVYDLVYNATNKLNLDYTEDGTTNKCFTTTAKGVVDNIGYLSITATIDSTTGLTLSQAQYTELAKNYAIIKYNNKLYYKAFNTFNTDGNIYFICPDIQYSVILEGATADAQNIYMDIIIFNFNVSTYTLYKTTFSLGTYYPASKVNSLITSIPTIQYTIVNSLPTADAAHDFNTTKTIYMVAQTGGSGDDYYNEYICVNTTGSTYAWEFIGTTKPDLTNYYTKSEVNLLLQGKQDSMTALSTDEINAICS